MADIKFECDECTQRVEVPSDMVGSTITCPRCGKKLVVPIIGPPVTPREPTDPGKAPPKISGKRAAAPCPKCGEPLPANSNRCGYCGEVASKRSVFGVGKGASIEQQIPQLAGFICLLTGVTLLARQQPSATYLPLLLLSFVLGVVSLVQKQVAAGIVVMLATVLVPLAIRSGSRAQFAMSSPPQVAPTPSWVDSVPQPTQRKVEPVTVTYPESPRPSRPPTPEAPRPAPVVTPQPAPAPRPISDDPFRDAFGPAPGEKPDPPQAAPDPVVPADPPGAPQGTPALTGPMLESDRICMALAANPEDLALLSKLKEEIKAITNEKKRARLIAAYSLGCLYVGRNSEAGSISRYLKKQYPDDVYVKLLSAENTTDPCSKCSGSGYAETECPECGGKGQCSGCSGTGSRQLNALNGQARKVSCGECRGSGKCKKCQGTGQAKGTCSECKGHKNMLSREKIKESLLSALGDKLGGSE